MRLHLPLLLGVILLAGCTPEDIPPEARKRIILDSLLVVVRDTPRSYLLSDKQGGFLVGRTHKEPGESRDIWTVNGREILHAISVRSGSRSLSEIGCDSCIVFPHKVTRFFNDGTQVSVFLLDGSPDNGNGHALAVKVKTRGVREIAIHPVVANEFSDPSSGASSLRWDLRGSGSALVLAGVHAPEVHDGSLLVRNADSASFLLLFSSRIEPQEKVLAFCDAADTMLAVRARRMEGLLNASYIRTSDRELNKALYWLKLSLDALLVEARDTFAVAGLPWDGSLDGRDNAQSIAGIGLATGDYAKTAAILRSLARWQDTDPARSTYGRIPDHVRRNRATYGGADVGAWFVRELYEHVTYANDTALVRLLYPAVKRSIEGTEKYHVDGRNLLVHGDLETWMDHTPRGNRASEIQLLWYFEQLIGSFVAKFAGEKAPAARWNAGANKTADSFNALFVDTTRNLVYDHIDRTGKGVRDIRPNPMMCLEIIGSELARQNTLKQIIHNLVHPYGVGTLDAGDKRFVASMGTGDEEAYNGPVWTWLTGQFVYALTRYDRQDFSYVLTGAMVKQVLEKDVVGSLPEMFEAAPGPGEAWPRAAGLQPSLTAMAELVRAVYQDYLGIHVDASSNVVSLQPKLPPHITEADFTVMVGSHPVNGLYQRGREVSRMVLLAPDITSPMKFNFIWMMENGDAWRGASVLLPNTPVHIVFGAEEILAYQGDKKTALSGEWKLKHFSRAAEFTGFDFAGSGAK